MHKVCSFNKFLAMCILQDAKDPQQYRISISFVLFMKMNCTKKRFIAVFWLGKFGQFHLQIFSFLFDHIIV